MDDWFFYQDQGQTVGPYTLEDLRAHIQEGRLKLHDLVYRDGEDGWLLASQHPMVRPEFRNDMDVGLEDRPWVCLHRKNEDAFDFVTKGPFSDEGVKEALASGELKYGDYAWKHGLVEWIRIGSTEQFNSRLKSADVAPTPPQASTSASQPLERAGGSAFPSGVQGNVDENELLRGVFKLERFQVEPPETPVGASGEDLTKRPPSLDFDPDRTRILNVAPAPAPAPDLPATDTSPTEVLPSETVTDIDGPGGSEKSFLRWTARARTALAARKRLIYRAAAALVPILGVLLWAALRHTPSSAPSPAPQTRAVSAAAPEAVTAPAPARVASPPSPAPVPVTPRVIPPSQIQLGVTEIDAGSAHVELRSDASADYPLTLNVIGLPGQVTTGPSSFQTRSFKSTGQITKPIAGTDLKLSPGIYLIRAESGGLRREVGFQTGLTGTAGLAEIARRRKTHYHAIFSERLHLYKLCLLAESAVTNARGASLPKDLLSLNEVTPSRGASYIFFADWTELREAVEQSRAQPAIAIERLKKLRAKIAAFTVWPTRS